MNRILRRASVLAGILALAAAMSWIVPRSAAAADQPRAGRASAAIQARIEAMRRAGRVAPMVEEAPPAATSTGTPQGLTCHLTETAGDGAFAAIQAQLQAVGGEAYGFSPTVRSFQVTVSTDAALEKLLARPEVAFIEESGERTAGDEYVPFNKDARDTHQVDELKGQFNVQGAGMTVAVWDGGTALASHVEFGGRVVLKDSDDPQTHATHVTGTIAARGVDRDAIGMAPYVKVLSYDWNDDVDEMAGAATDGAVATNHSYGYLRGWNFSHQYNRWEWWGDPGQSETEDYLFGKYIGVSRDFDQVARDNPKLSIFVAAGNDRNDDPATDPAWNDQHYVPATGEWSTKKREPDGFDAGGFDTVEGASVAKNVITIGAIEDIVDPDPDDGVEVVPTAADVHVTAFSSWGPTDDGRVKPDLVANGDYLYSPTVKDELTNAYTSLSGTSMATPVATGIAALLDELAKNKIGRTLYSDELKALLIHTALSPFTGPTYQIGWGSIMADAAGQTLAREGAVRRATLAQGRAAWQLRGQANRAIKVTLVWLDPPGNPSTEGLDDRSRNLVNDLDLTVKSPQGTVHYPWSLDPTKPQQPATRVGPNRVDNVERVEVAAAEVKTGTWEVAVSSQAGALPQEFALVIDGLEEIKK